MGCLKLTYYPEFLHLIKETAIEKSDHINFLPLGEKNAGKEKCDNYYPFGLTFNNYSRENSIKNNYLYNGKEQQHDLDLGWYDYQARQYDPMLGRFTSVDPAAELMRRVSPYAYAFNNPVRFTDPDGMVPEDKTNKDYEAEWARIDANGGFSKSFGSLGSGGVVNATAGKSNATTGKEKDDTNTNTATSGETDPKKKSENERCPSGDCPSGWDQVKTGWKHLFQELGDDSGLTALGEGIGSGLKSIYGWLTDVLKKNETPIAVEDKQASERGAGTGTTNPLFDPKATAVGKDASTLVTSSQGQSKVTNPQSLEGVKMDSIPLGGIHMDVKNGRDSIFSVYMVNGKQVIVFNKTVGQ